MAGVFESEQWWLTWDNWAYLADVADNRATDRQNHLFASACIRMGWDHLTIPQARTVVEVVEAVADRQARKEQLKAARRALEAAITETEVLVAKEVWLSTSRRPWEVDGDEATEWTPQDVAAHPQVSHARRLLDFIRRIENPNRVSFGNLWWPIGGPRRFSLTPMAEKAESEYRCALLRDLLGNPFRPVAFDPSWRTDTAVSLARQMYDSRDFAAMPILADALQDAGCESADFLDHCHGPGPHVRGCWVVDRVLAKA